MSAASGGRPAWVVGPLVAAASLASTLLLAEGLLRAFPGRLLPAGNYGAGRFDPALGLSVAASPSYYNKVRFVYKVPNPSGFMDVAHEVAKPTGVVRVGFFGDSYVEAHQVELQRTFFRKLPDRIAGTPIEPLAFGVSGWGTLHALIAFEREGSRYDLDRVVYLFVENDLADNCYSTSGRRGVSPLPYAEPSDAPPGYSLRWSRPPGEEPAWLPLVKAVQRHSLLFQLSHARLRLLRDRGVRARARAEDVQMSGRGHPVMEPATVLSAWPPELRAEVEGVGRALLADWKARAEARGIAFAVLYVPRGEDQLRGELPEHETWLPWLRRTCAELGIALIDPFDALRSRLERGDPVYDDHWSAAGHEVIAGLLAGDLEGWLQARAPSGR
jgi:hypothetical protein